MTYSKKAVDPTAQKYLEQAIGLDSGDVIEIAMDSEEEAVRFRYNLYSVLNQFKEIDPYAAATIGFSIVTAEGQSFLLIKKKQHIPTHAIIKKKDGSIQELKVNADERHNQLRKMVIDGCTLKEIKHIMGELSEEELVIVEQESS